MFAALSKKRTVVAKAAPLAQLQGAVPKVASEAARRLNIDCPSAPLQRRPAPHEGQEAVIGPPRQVPRTLPIDVLQAADEVASSSIGKSPDQHATSMRAPSPPQVPAPAPTEPPLNEHEVQQFMEVVDGKDVAQKRLDSVRQELHRCAVTPRELWSVKQSFLGHTWAAPPGNGLAAAFHLLRHRRLKRGSILPLPDVRRVHQESTQRVDLG